MSNMGIKVSVKDIPELIEQLEKAEKNINDLEQENKQLKDKIEKLKDYGEKVGERRNELYNKIDKAIDYIKNNTYNTGWLEIGSSDVKELLKILGDKE